VKIVSFFKRTLLYFHMYSITCSLSTADEGFTVITVGCYNARPDNLASKYSSCRKSIRRPFILRPLSRSGQELPVEYQVELFFVKFSMSTVKKGSRQGPASAIVCIRGSLVKERSHSDSTSTKIMGKSHRKNPTFYVFTPWLFLYFVGI
jgi:hypothetical protein